jgi:hypothetical protein
MRTLPLRSCSKDQRRGEEGELQQRAAGQSHGEECVTHDVSPYLKVVSRQVIDWMLRLAVGLKREACQARG